MGAMFEPPREIRMEVAIAWWPSLWRLWPEVDRKAPSGWRGGFSVTFLCVRLQRWWRYV